MFGWEFEFEGIKKVLHEEAVQLSAALMAKLLQKGMSPEEAYEWTNEHALLILHEHNTHTPFIQSLLRGMAEIPDDFKETLEEMKREHILWLQTRTERKQYGDLVS